MPVTSQQYIHRRKLKRQKIKLALYGGGFFLCACALFYFFLLGPYFHIKNTKISGQNVVPQSVIQKVIDRAALKKSLYFFSSNNIFIFSGGWARGMIESISPNIESALVHKNFWRKEIAVTILEREPHGIWCRGEQYNDCLYFDKVGMVFMNAPMPKEALMLLIQEDEAVDIILPFKKYSQETIDFLSALKKDIFEISGVTLHSFTLRQYGDIEARSAGDFTVFLTTKQSSQKQAEILKNIIQKEVGEDVTRLDYIDLRIKNRVYFKLKE